MVNKGEKRFKIETETGLLGQSYKGAILCRKQRYNCVV